MTLPIQSVLKTYYDNRANFPSIASATDYFWSSEETPSGQQLGGRDVYFSTGALHNRTKTAGNRVFCIAN